MKKCKKLFCGILFIIFLSFSFNLNPAYAAITTFIVPAISDNKILPKSSISSSYISNAISTRVSRGEYKALSFVVNSTENIGSFQVEASDLTGSAGTISNSAVDLRAVKCWYQGGSGKADYYVTGRYLTPELLLKDDSLINVDGDTWNSLITSNPDGKNYLKVNGSYIDVSGTTAPTEYRWRAPIADRPINDATTLQAINLPATYNKQFWITLHIPDDTADGNYSGTISLKNGTQTIGSIALELEVLPITLPESSLDYTIYYRGRINGNGSISSEDKTVTQYTAEMADMHSHGVNNPTFYSFGTDSNLIQQLTIRQQAGMNNINFYNWSPNGSTATADYLSYYKNLTAPYGVVNWFEYGPDETDLTVPASKAQIDLEHSAGALHFDAQTAAQAQAAASFLDSAIVGSLSPSTAALYHNYGHKIYSYGNPQIAPEFPQTFRTNYGLSLWQADYDGAMDYVYQSSEGDLWNDFDESTWRDFVFAYPTANGVVDTIQWEGFREGINDVRYLDALKNEIASARARGDSAIADEAEAYINNLKTANLANMDLDSVRSQIVDYILACKNSSHYLLVSQGSGSGFYTPGTTVTINASAAPAGMEFEKWVGDTEYLTDANSPTATVTMPDKAISLNVSYKSLQTYWYNAAWKYRKALIINRSKVVNTDQTDFPLLVSIIDTDLKSVENGGKVQNSNGYDIIFALSNNNLLNSEIESYNPATGELVAWVRMPHVSASSDTSLDMYYGNADITSPISSPNNVWDSNYKGVWHLNETGTGNVGDFKDSSSNGNDSVNTSGQPTATIGQIGRAQSFNGSTSYLDLGNKNSLDITGPISISAWVRLDAPTNPYIIAKNLSSFGDVVYGWQWLSDTQRLSFWESGGGVTSKGGIVVSGNLYRIDMTYDGMNVNWYLNGALKGTNALSTPIAINTGSLYLGKRNGGNPAFTGFMDEVRISDSVRSADLIETEYNNQSNPSTFLALSAEEGYTDISTINTLSALTLSSGTLSPTFSSATTSYTASVANTVSSLTITPTVSESHATVTVNGTLVSSGSASSPINLSVGSNTITIIVTAQDTTTKTYTLTVNRAAASSGGSGGSGGGGGSTHPKPHPREIKVTGVEGSTVSLSILADDASTMTLADNPNFTGSLWEPYQTSKTYTKKDTQTKIYLKFKSSYSILSDTVTVDIPSAGEDTGGSIYPTGTLLKLSSSPKVYVIIDGKKKWISTPEVFEQLGYKWGSIQTVTNEQLSAIPDYEDNLIRQIGDYKVYLVVNGVKRHIPSPEVFLNYGFAWSDVKDVDASVITKYQDTYLLKESGKDGIYYVNQDGIRKLIPTDIVFKSYGDKYEDVQVISSYEMNLYPLSNLIRLGSSGDIYLVEGNIKKKIASVEAFNKYGFNWNHIMSVNQTEFNFYGNGGEVR